jgi:hypothetical protein
VRTLTAVSRHCCVIMIGLSSTWHTFIPPALGELVVLSTMHVDCRPQAVCHLCHHHVSFAMVTDVIQAAPQLRTD